MRPSAHKQNGFTLLESVIVIMLIGIVGGMVAVFIRSPIDAYVDMGRRAELTDIADTAVRRMARDIRIALPNSVRHPTDGSDQCVEFMPTKSGGRYRAVVTATGTGNILDFTASDGSFDMLGDNTSLPSGEVIAANDVVVVYNDGSTSGSAYTGANAIKLSGVGAANADGSTTLTFDATAGVPFAIKQLPAASPSNRFHVLSGSEHVVAYACSGTSLFRYSRTLTGSWSQPTSCANMISGATANLLASNVSSCSIKYEPPGSGTGAGRFGIVSISLAMTQSGESVNLYHQVQVNNAP